MRVTTVYDPAESSPRDLDPTVRRNFINSMPPPKRMTALVRGYVESRVGCKDKRESAACRSLLKTWHAIEADGNEMGIGLAVMRAEQDCVQFFFNIHGVGPVTWLPVLVTASNDRTTHILRETSPDRIALAQPTRGPVDPLEEARRRRVPPKPVTVLIPGRRP